MVRFSDITKKTELEDFKVENDISRLPNEIGELDDSKKMPDTMLELSLFDCKESDFRFNDEIDEVLVGHLIENLDLNNWDELSEEIKEQKTIDFAKKVQEMLGIKDIAQVSFEGASKNDLGAFNPNDNEISLNKGLLNNPEELINTIAHEARHAYQYKKACNPDSELDYLYRENFDNYFTPILYEGYWVGFDVYEGQLIEAEARAYANKFSERVGII